MRIAGIQKMSTVDYPGKLSAVIFTQGCNFRCGYCHNPTLIDKETSEPLRCEEILAFLERRKGLLDGVVVSGGEPTLQEDLEVFLGRIREKGFLVKLDTNGSRPQVLERLLNYKLLNYVAMDIKAPFIKYGRICGTSVSLDALKQSMALLDKSGIPYEYRTTYAPQLSEEDLVEIAENLEASTPYVLQQYRRTGTEASGGGGPSERRSIAAFLKSGAAKRLGALQVRGEFVMIENRA